MASVVDVLFFCDQEGRLQHTSMLDTNRLDTCEFSQTSKDVRFVSFTRSLGSLLADVTEPSEPMRSYVIGATSLVDRTLDV